MSKDLRKIPFGWKGVGRFGLFLLSAGLCVFNWYLLVYAWNLLEIDFFYADGMYEFGHLLILYPLLAQYVVISLCVVCFVAWLKGGYGKLKSVKDGGLVDGLVFGLFVGIIGGLVFRLVFRLVGGLVVGLIGGLVFGLMCGLSEEYS